jgi:hypothetical protein
MFRSISRLSQNRNQETDVRYQGKASYLVGWANALPAQHLRKCWADKALAQPTRCFEFTLSRQPI